MACTGCTYQLHQALFPPLAPPASAHPSLPALPSPPPQVRALFHAFIEAFFQLPCSCEAAEERRRAQPVRTADAPMVRRGRRPKAAASEPNSMEVRPGLVLHSVVLLTCSRHAKWARLALRPNSWRGRRLLLVQ